MADDSERVGARRHGGAFRRILVGFDGSSEAQQALRAALDLAADLRAEVHVLLVLRPPAHVETDAERQAALDAEEANLSRGLSELRATAPHLPEVGIDVVSADDPAGALAGFAAEHGFDLVVVGGHGREQGTHRGLGRSLEALLRDHPCPVMVI